MADNKAPQENPDARFRFAMSEDGMKLGVNRYFPPNGGKKPSVDILRKQVLDAGVQLPLDESAAQRIIDAIETGNDFKGIALVRGIPATEPKDASLMALGNLEFPVFPGDRFIRFREAQKAENGQTIDGRILTPKGNFAPQDISVEPGENVKWDPVTESYVAEVWGMARVKDNVVSVSPIPSISNDEVFVTGNIHHQDFKGNPITPARIDKELRDLGVVIDVDMDMLDAKLAQAKDLGIPLQNQVLVKGVHPVPGRDGWLEYLVTTREITGTEDESGRLDFRNRGTYPMVNPGQIIGRVHQPTPGEGGIDIYGKTIPAHEGKELRIHLGENVILQDDKVTFQSKAKGVVVMEKNTLSVTECLIISGNVDLNSGNVKVEHGSIKVLGSIQAGFSVSAPKHVIVEGSIESATVYAGGQVEVKGGILMPDGGSIVCEGDVIANFITNANIKAGGDIHVANEILNSKIQAAGRLYATSGKGVVNGGTILTHKGMEINETGSELGVSTVIGVHLEQQEDDELRSERDKIILAIKKIDEALGSEPPQIILSRTPKEKRPAVAEVLKHRATLAKRRKTINERITELALAQQQELNGIDIQIRRLAHPGTTIRFGKKAKQIAKRMEACTFYFSLKDRDIAIK
nr:FapA family protein [uncultured Pseudodesulfovibrio sp.]